ncbi:MAG: SDR family oxidoreductase [Leptospiraceae bacterium]|nr:SDR family oxidoreductase [Leptospiraceae bacterium]MDW7976777.1 SDR family oxidoreductase [Leptospiraceae bacterium]
MKNYFLLGASKGIGFGIALELVKKGNRVFLGSRNPTNLEKAKEILDQIQPNFTLYESVDVSSYESMERWFNVGISKFGTIDGLLINYGGPPAGSFFDFHDKDWQQAFEFMLLNPIRLLRLSYPYLKQSQGSVLVITSLAVKEPIENLLLSNVFRSAITSLIKTLSFEWAPEVRLNCLMPGRIDTDRIRELEEKNATKWQKTASEIREEFLKKIPLKRYGTIEEIGKTGAFLLSEESSYITGTSILVDGGISRSLF